MTTLTFDEQTERTVSSAPSGSGTPLRLISAVALSFWGLTGAATASYPTAPRHEEIAYVSFQTGNGTAVAATAQAGTESGTAVEIRALRETSGLSWQQIARLFGVSRRAVHMWAAGGRMTDHHAELLERHLAVVRHHDQGEMEATRKHLLSVGQGHRSPYQLMVDYQIRCREKPLRGELSTATLLGASEPTPCRAPKSSAAVVD